MRLMAHETVLKYYRRAAQCTVSLMVFLLAETVKWFSPPRLSVRQHRAVVSSQSTFI